MRHFIGVHELSMETNCVRNKVTFPATSTLRCLGRSFHFTRLIRKRIIGVFFPSTQPQTSCLDFDFIVFLLQVNCSLFFFFLGLTMFILYNETP